MAKKQAELASVLMTVPPEEIIEAVRVVKKMRTALRRYRTAYRMSTGITVYDDQMFKHADRLAREALEEA